MRRKCVPALLNDIPEDRSPATQSCHMPPLLFPSSNRLRLQSFFFLPLLRPLSLSPFRFTTATAMDNLETLNSRLICVWLHVFVERERNELSRNKTHVLSRPLPREISSSRTGPPLFRISFAGRRASYKKRLLLMRWFGAGSSPTYLRRTLTNRFETLFPRGTRFRRHGTRLERGGEVKDSSALPLSSVGRSVISRFLSIIPLARTRERNPNSSCAIHCIYDIVYYSRISYSLESGAKHLDSNGITRAKDGRISALLHGCIVSTGLEVTTFRPSRYICINCLEGEGRGRKVE